MSDAPLNDSGSAQITKGLAELFSPNVRPSKKRANRILSYPHPEREEPGSSKPESDMEHMKSGRQPDEESGGGPLAGLSDLLPAKRPTEEPAGTVTGTVSALPSLQLNMSNDVADLEWSDYESAAGYALRCKKLDPIEDDDFESVLEEEKQWLVKLRAAFDAPFKASFGKAVAAMDEEAISNRWDAYQAGGMEKLKTALGEGFRLLDGQDAPDSRTFVVQRIEAAAWVLLVSPLFATLLIERAANKQ